MQQIFLNLVQNALDASPPGTSVRLYEGNEPHLKPDGRASNRRGSVAGAHLDIHILDQGKGMTTEELDHIFEPFFSTKEGGAGTGLGLAVVEEIVRAHRGEIEMLSIPGQGTEAIVRLPLAAVPGAAPSPPPAEAERHA